MIYETRKIGRVSILFEARIEIDSGNSVLGFGGFISWKESENPGGVDLTFFAPLLSFSVRWHAK